MGFPFCTQQSALQKAISQRGGTCRGSQSQTKSKMKRLQNPSKGFNQCSSCEGHHICNKPFVHNQGPLLSILAINNTTGSPAGRTHSGAVHNLDFTVWPLITALFSTLKTKGEWWCFECIQGALPCCCYNFVLEARGGGGATGHTRTPTYLA